MCVIILLSYIVIKMYDKITPNATISIKTVHAHNHPYLLLRISIIISLIKFFISLLYRVFSSYLFSHVSLPKSLSHNNGNITIPSNNINRPKQINNNSTTVCLLSMYQFFINAFIPYRASPCYFLFLISYCIHFCLSFTGQSDISDVRSVKLPVIFTV